MGLVADIQEQDVHRRYPPSVHPGIPRLGELKKGWQRLSIGDLFEEVPRPVNMDDNQNYRLLTVKRSRGGVVERERLPGSKIAVKSQFFVKEGDFVISKRQIVHGACGFVPEDLDGAIVSNEYSVLRCKAVITPDYLNFLSHTPYFQQTCFHSSIGVHIEKMIFKLADWFRWKIDLPSIEEQSHKSGFLVSNDQKLTKLKEKHALLKTWKKGMMQKLFSQEIRFKREDGSEFPAWENKRFGEVFTRVVRKNSEQNQNVLTISSQLGLVNQEDYFSKSVAAKDVSGYYLLQKGEFAYNKSYSNGYPLGAIKRLNHYDTGVVSTLYICFSACEETTSLFFAQYFEHGGLNHEIHKIAQEGARNHGLLNVSVVEFFNDIKIPYPSLGEQKKIANYLMAIDQKIKATAQQIQTMETFKKGLLQKMFV